MQQKGDGWQGQRLAIWVSVLVVMGTALAPTWWAMGRNALRLWQEFDWTLATSPAFYGFGWFALSALVTPLGGLLRLLPAQQLEDSSTRTLVGYLAASVGWVVGMTWVWLLGAWLCYPLLNDGQLRMIPLYPWPDFSLREFVWR